MKTTPAPSAIMQELRQLEQMLRTAVTTITQSESSPNNMRRLRNIKTALRAMLERLDAHMGGSSERLSQPGRQEPSGGIFVVGPNDQELEDILERMDKSLTRLMRFGSTEQLTGTREAIERMMTEIDTHLYGPPAVPRRRTP